MLFIKTITPEWKRNMKSAKLTKMRFNFLFLALFVSLIAFSQNQKIETQPNIIFILTDDQRFDALSYTGNKYIHTPEMDKLAKNGVYFKNAMVTSPICSASRATIFTGLYERSHRYSFSASEVRKEYMDNSYPAILKENGYQTAFFGKYGVKNKEIQNQFDVYETYDRNEKFKDKRGYYYKTIRNDTVHLTRYTGQKAIDFIEQRKSDKPFCLSLSFSAPHAHDPAKDQYFWQKKSDLLLKNIEIPAPKKGDQKYFDKLPKSVSEGFNRTRWYWRYDTPKKYQHSVKGYYRMISGIDREIKKIRAKLKEKKINKNTIIILMGDNGYFLGERQLAGKWLMYDNSIRVPLIIYDPRQKKAVDSEVLALNVDIPPTILDFAGIKKPKTWHGKSLLPIVSNIERKLDRDTVLIEHLWEVKYIPPSEGVRTKDWKYIRYVNDQSIEELYHLKNDPEEKNNLALDTKYTQKLKIFRKTCESLAQKYSNQYSKGPKNLIVEYIKNTDKVKVIDPNPEFGWVVPKVVISQSAYQILVASFLNKLNNNIGDVWNSGQVRSNATDDIEYAGTELKVGGKYFWKVRIWNESNHLSEYSTYQAFEVGTANKTILTKNSFQIKASQKSAWLPQVRMQMRQDSL